MASIDDIIKEISTKSEKLIKESLAEYVSEANSDLSKFLILSKAKLHRYSKQFENGELSKEEVEWLIKSQSNLIEMKHLEQVGLKKVRADRFKRQLLAIITKAIIGNAI